MIGNFLLRRFDNKPAAMAVLLGAALLLASVAWAQDTPSQRTFSASLAEAQAAVRAIRGTLQGRLPTLEGFVQGNNESFARYKKGYYECSFQISSGSVGTVVQATAKITAWYDDPDVSKSGYRVLVSNGRLEADALDRIAEALGAKVAADETPLSSAKLSPSAPTPHVPVDQPLVSSETTVESMKAIRAEDEKKSAELTNLIKNLEEIQHNQSHPDDLAVVKSPKTLILAKPAENAPVLMSAEAQDEFPVLGLDGSWVHVQISGISRGWIRRTQLDMPDGFSQAGNTNKNSSESAATFKVAREETRPFSGNWPALKGKLVRIEWVELVNPGMASSQKEKLAFAKSVFLQVSEKLLGSAPNLEGVVVVFDSADGGQIAAPLSSVRALADGSVSDAAFWRQCSLDPAESFLDPGKS
jgi:hypothetical protein